MLLLAILSSLLDPKVVSVVLVVFVDADNVHPPTICLFHYPFYLHVLHQYWWWKMVWMMC